MFCVNCGAKLKDGDKFCVSCGVSLRPKDHEPPSTPTGSSPVSLPAQAGSNNTVVHGRLRKKIMDKVMIPLAIILILLGIGNMALTVTGKTVTAQVTGYEQVMYLNNDESTRNPRRYQLDYQFAVKGKRYTGSVTRVFEGGSQTRNTIPVIYLPFWPHVNAEDSRGVNLAGPVMLGAGILLLVFEVRKFRTFQRC